MGAWKQWRCFVRVIVMRDGWSSASETPTFFVEASSAIDAAMVAARVVNPSDINGAMAANVAVVNDAADRVEWYTTRREDGCWCDVRAWDPTEDLKTEVK